VIFVDSNVPMYVVGASHPNKAAAAGALESALLAGERLVTSAEVLQEILHRYCAIRRMPLVDQCLAVITGLVDRVLPVEQRDVLAARDLIAEHRLGARDALHVAVMQRHGIEHVLSFDTHFDRVPGLLRLP